MAPLFKIEADHLALIKRTQACLLDGGDVDEDILAAVVGLDEAKPLCWIEPFDGAMGHDVLQVGLRGRR